MAAVDLAEVAKERKIKYFLISFVDPLGRLRAKLVPAQAIGGHCQTKNLAISQLVSPP